MHVFRGPRHPDPYTRRDGRTVSNHTLRHAWNETEGRWVQRCCDRPVILHEADICRSCHWEWDSVGVHKEEVTMP